MQTLAATPAPQLVPLPLPPHGFDRRRERHCSVVVIDDRRGDVTSLLEAPGYHVSAMSAADAGGLSFEDLAADVVLVRLSGRPGGGVGLLQRLKQTTDTPVIALVQGRDFFETNYQLRIAVASGADVGVVLPVTGDRLRAAVDQARRSGVRRPGAAF